MLLSQIEVAERTVIPAVVRAHLSHALTSVSNKGLLWASRPNSGQFKRSFKVENFTVTFHERNSTVQYSTCKLTESVPVSNRLWHASARAPRTRSCERPHLIALKSNVCPLRPHGQPAG
jgi:hypothetical protein